MNRQELRVFLGPHFCGCGNPQAAAMAMLKVLRLHPLYEHRAELQAALPDEGVRYLVLYWLDKLELTEHGGGVEGGWLTDFGKDVLAAMEREAIDDFEAFWEQHCIHGYDVTDETHDCLTAS